MTVQDYDLGYYEGVRNILQIVLRMNSNTEALLQEIRRELEDAKDCMDDSKKDEN
jgi:hypothetical protein